MVESYSQLKTALGIGVKVSGRYGRVSAAAETNYSKSKDVTQSNYYATRAARIFINRQAVQNQQTLLTLVRQSLEQAMRQRQPRTFADYENLLKKFGSHVCTGVIHGGRMDLIVRVSQSATMTKEQISGKVSAAYDGLVFGGKAEITAQSARQQLASQKNYDATVYSRGGKGEKAAAITSFDNKKYDAWIATVRANPAVISYELKGIWEVFPQGSPNRVKLASAYNRLANAVQYGDEINLTTNGKNYLSPTGPVQVQGGQALNEVVTNRADSAKAHSLMSRGFVWRMWKQRDSNRKYNLGRINYGDEVYIHAGSSDAGLTGNRSRYEAQFNSVYVCNPVTENEKKLLVWYKWKIQKSDTEVGSGPVMYGEPVHLGCRYINRTVRFDGHTWLSGARFTRQTGVKVGLKRTPYERNNASGSYMWTVQRAFSR